MAIRVKVHWAIWLRSGLLTKVWCLDARFWYPKRSLFLDVVPDGLVVGGLGIGQGGVWTGSYKGFAGSGKGLSHILLLAGKFWRGIPDQQAQNLAQTRKSQKCSQRSQEAPGPSKKNKKKKHFFGPRALRALFGPTGPLGPRGPRGPCMSLDPWGPCFWNRVGD